MCKKNYKQNLHTESKLLKEKLKKKHNFCMYLFT